jgi:hypothetical protein
VVNLKLGTWLGSGSGLGLELGLGLGIGRGKGLGLELRVGVAYRLAREEAGERAGHRVHAPVH